MSNAAVPVATNIDIRMHLEKQTSKVGLNKLAGFASMKKDLVQGKKLYDKYFVRSHEWQFTDTYFVASKARIEEDIKKLTTAQKWPKILADHIEAVAMFEGYEHQEVNVSFRSQISSECCFCVVAVYTATNGYQHIKVKYAKNTATLAAGAKSISFEDEGIIYAIENLLSSAIRLFTVGPSTNAKPKVLINQKGGDAEKIQKYLQFTMAQTIVQMDRECLNGCDEQTKAMVDWRPENEG